MIKRPLFYGGSVAACLIAALSVCPARAETKPPQTTSPPAIELRTEYQVLSTKFARSVPGWRPHAPKVGSLLFIAPDEYTPADKEGNVFRDERNQYADSLFALAKRAAAAGQLSLAFQWATETLRENPDHADARRVLGYEQQGGCWLTPYGMRQAESGKSWHPKFGWIAPGDAARYEAGERQVGGRWVSAESDATRHRELKNGWQVRTDHFLVTTNHSLEAASELAARLERLHQVWRQLFAGFYLTENEVRRLFAGEREPRRQVRPFRVYYHRNRDQYTAALYRLQPKIDQTLGIYFDTKREAHFFAGEDQDAGTLYHEAVHQLFQESKPSAKHVGDNVNFWVIEGVATYFETLTEHDDPQAGRYYTVGEPQAGRLPSARLRLSQGFYVPLVELTRLGKNGVQRHPEIIKLYSQTAGLAAFLIGGDEGRYGEPFVRYLDAVYAGRDTDQTLAEVTGVGYDKLDAGYHRYLQSLP